MQLLVLQPTTFCNLDCDYCYLPNRDRKDQLSLKTLSSLLEQLFSSALPGSRLTLAWHSGEPLVLGVRYYREAFEIVDRLKPSDIALRHDIQTNGTLIDDEWCALISENSATVGLSIDGPSFLHDARRRRRNGTGSLSDALRGLRCLQDHGIDCHVITVLTRKALDHADALYEFYRAHDIGRVGFNIEELEGVHRTTSLIEPRGNGTIEDKFRTFIDRFLERIAAERPARISLREADGFLKALLGRQPLPLTNQQVVPGAIVSVDTQGNLSTYSPELLGIRNPDYDDFVLAGPGASGDGAAPHAENVFDTLLSTAGVSRMGREIVAGVERCRAECAYFDLCGGGAPANKLFENGRFDTTETLFCQLNRKVLIEALLDFLEHRVPAQDSLRPSERTIHATP